MMTTYISFETALRMLANAYLVSVTVSLLASYIGWVLIETIQADKPSPNPKWFA